MQPGLRAGGWGNPNVFQVDLQMPVRTADSATPRMQVLGIDDYCYGGPARAEVPAELPVPEGANIEGSSDLTCDIFGNTDGQGDCPGPLHLGPGQGFPIAALTPTAG